MLSKEEWLDKISEDAEMLEYAPLFYKQDREFCLAALQRNGWALHYVPYEISDKEIFLTAIQGYTDGIELVPEEMMDREFCLAAVQRNGKVLYYVPRELRDSQICLTAVQQNREAFRYVPEEVRDREIFHAAVRQDGWALVHVPAELKDRELCLTAVSQNGRALEHVPAELRDNQICLTAVQQDWRALEDVPEEIADNQICLTAVQQYGRALEDVPEELKAEVEAILGGKQVIFDLTFEKTSGEQETFEEVCKDCYRNELHGFYSSQGYLPFPRNERVGECSLCKEKRKVA